MPTFSNFQLTYSGQLNFSAPLLTAFHQPSDRYTELRSISPSVTLVLSPIQLAALPVNFDGFQIERSDDQGQTWAAVSGWVRDSFYYVDIPGSVGIFYYRCRMRLSGGQLTNYSNVAIVSNGKWDDVDDLSVQEINPGTNQITDRWATTQAFPQGLDGEKHTGGNSSIGSMLGAYGSGVWYLASKETQAPQIVNNAPACGAVNVALPLVSITYTIEDLPNPGGSGIDDTTLIVLLSVSSQYGGAFILIRQGATEPWNPTILCASVPGADPVLDRDITITVPAGYIQSDDVVQVQTIVYDNDGNELRHLCSFTMIHQDPDPPVVSDQNPVCGTGITVGTTPVRRDTTYSFKVTDTDSGINLATLQVYTGTSSGGPWSQVLQNGATFLLGYTGTVISDGAGGYDVTIVRPVSDPYWPANSTVCFRVTADDNSGNSVEDICCFKTQECVTIKQVVPLADDLLMVEFTDEVLDGELLKATENWIIVADVTDPDASPVQVKKVIPQKFLPPKDPLQTGPQRLGVGNPKYVLLQTSQHTPWGVYRIRTQQLLDALSLPHCSWSDNGVKYRGQFTAYNEGRADLSDESVLGEDSQWMAGLLSILYPNQQLGGVFIPDDWDDI